MHLDKLPYGHRGRLTGTQANWQTRIMHIQSVNGQQEAVSQLSLLMPCNDTRILKGNTIKTRN